MYNCRKKARSIQAVAILTASLVLVACSPEPAGGPVQMRKLTEAQYRNIIRDVFGPEIEIVGRFESEKRVDGLLTIGNSKASVTEAGMEQFFAMGNQIARQVVSETHRDNTLGCEPATEGAADDSCISEFFRRVGRLLLRRALDEDELRQWVDQSRDAAASTGDIYSGLAIALSGLLISPELLFRMESTEPDPTRSGMQRLTAYSIAARLSFLLWNTAPDDALLSAAETGELHQEEELNIQVGRLLESPRLEHGARAFFRDFLRMEHFANLQKDKLIYPAFDDRVSLSAEEQILKMLTAHLLDKDQNYLELFTTRETFMNRPLGMIYAVPVKSREGWEPYTFDPEDPRVGLLSHVGFTALHSHRGRSSPTLRGIAMRERLMCQPVKPAPAAVNFTVVQDTNHPEFKTARERLTAHRTEKVCAGCHKFYDPMGLGLENFDGAGMYRSKENGVLIDTSGELDGVRFNTVAELGQVMHDNPLVPVCLVNSVYKYAVGREMTESEYNWILRIEKRFAKDGYRYKSLLQSIATSDTFYTIFEDSEPAAKSEIAASEGYEDESTS